MKDKHVLILTPDLEFGGAERAVHYMGEALAEKYQVTECVFNTFNGIAFPTKNFLLDLSIPGSNNVFSKFINFYKRCAKVKKYKREHNVAVCISQLEGADYVNLLTKGKELSIICIQGSKWHDGEIKGLTGYIRKRFLMPYLYRKADKIVAVSEDIEAELIRYFNIPAEKITVIENACDINMVLEKIKEPIPEALDQHLQQYTTIVSTGRLANQKNQAPLLEIFKKITQTKPDCKLIIAGDGPLRENLFAKCKSVGLTYWYYPDSSAIPPKWDVLFLGFQENPFKFMRGRSVFVLPSGWEGFPLALIEALACELPVISSNCPTGPREILAGNQPTTESSYVGQYGVLLPIPREGDEVINSHWTNSILEILNNKERTNQYKSLALARAEQFSVKKIHDRWIALIEELSTKQS